MMKKVFAMAAMAVTAQAYEIDLDMLQGTEEPYEYPMGARVTVSGVENRSWGYAWAIKNECGARFNLVDDQYGYDEPKGGMELALGRQGRRTLTFEVPGPESNALQGVPCKVTFTNKRPWLEEADSPDDIKTITVVVGEKQDEEL